jgi:hypothetical protein
VERGKALMWACISLFCTVAYTVCRVEFEIGSRIEGGIESVGEVSLTRSRLCFTASLKFLLDWS